MPLVFENLIWKYAFCMRDFSYELEAIHNKAPSEGVNNKDRYQF